MNGPETGSTEAQWPELLRAPGHGHFVQLYQDDEFLCDAVAHYAGAALERGEAVLIIATPAHRAAFRKRLPASDGLRLLDAEETLAQFIGGTGLPDWRKFHALVSGLIAELRLSFPAVRAYGEMVDILWQRGERDAAVLLENYWNDLAQLQAFSLLCSYRMDNLDEAAYNGPLECLCSAHTHLIPAPDYLHFNEAVVEASRKVLDEPLADMLLWISANHKPGTEMPDGQARLLWLMHNMPRTASRVLAETRARCRENNR